MESAGEIESKKAHQKIVWREFIYFNVGIFLIFSSFSALFNLQSSINIEDGLGTTSLAISYFASILFGLLVTPVLLRRYGAKKCIIASDFSYLVYILVNIYPEYYTLIPGGSIMAFGEATVWPGMCMMNVYFATKFKLVSKKEKDFYINLFSGYFFVSYQANQVFGNLLSYLFLYAIDQNLPAGNSTGFNSSCQTSNDTHCESSVNDFSYCGSRDCQNASLINENINQYQPVNQLTMYIMIGTLTLLTLFATFLHVVFLPDTGSYVKNTVSVALLKAKSIEVLPERASSPALSECSENEKVASDVDSIEENELKVTEMSPMDNNLTVVKSRKWKTHGDSRKLIVHTCKAIMRQFLRGPQILLIPITLYNGLAMGFAFAELTRSYASCVLGVKWVGICMAIYGLADCLMSWFVGRYGRKIGRTKLYLLAFLVETSNYVYCLLWVPSVETSWTIFVVFFTFGFTDGIHQTIINVAHIDFFPDDQEVALSVWNLLVIAGFTIEYAYSSVLCVNIKVYINLIFLLLGCIGAVCSELLHAKIKGKL